MARKGMVFSLDAMFAVFIMIAAVLTIEYFSFQAEKTPYTKLQLERVGNDILAVLDNDLILQSNNMTMISERITESIPQNTSWHISISKYSRESGNNASGFNFLTMNDYGNSPPSDKQVYEVRRDFLSLGARVTNDTRVMNYSIVRMKIWKE